MYPLLSAVRWTNSGLAVRTTLPSPKTRVHCCVRNSVVARPTRDSSSFADNAVYPGQTLSYDAHWTIYNFIIAKNFFHTMIHFVRTACAIRRFVPATCCGLILSAPEDGFGINVALFLPLCSPPCVFTASGPLNGLLLRLTALLHC